VSTFALILAAVWFVSWEYEADFPSDTLELSVDTQSWVTIAPSSYSVVGNCEFRVDVTEFVRVFPRAIFRVRREL